MQEKSVSFAGLILQDSREGGEILVGNVADFLDCVIFAVSQGMME